MKPKSSFTFSLQRRNIKQLLFLYSCALLYIVFLTPNRYRADAKPEAVLLPIINTIRRFYGRGNEHFWPYYIEYWGNLFGNIFLFAPFGFLIKCLYPQRSFWQICFYGFLLSVCIELTQLILQIGVCDIDDVILNVTGTATGLYLYKFVRRRKEEWFSNLM